MKLLYPLAKRFIAGHDFNSAKPRIQKLIDEGYEVSIDYLGELSSTVLDCERAKNQYVEIINFYKLQKVDISIKPSQLGLLIHPLLSYRHIEFLAKMANLRGHTVRLDMEDSSVTELTRNLAISLNKKYGNVGVAIQANLLRTPQDLQLLIKNNVSVRLVKGAYKEASEIAHQTETNVNLAFFDYAASLVGENKPAIGTHDQELLDDVTEILPNPKQFDYEFLYGIRRDVQKRMRDEGYKVRVYVPFGEDWLPYTLRRLREWKNLKFVIKNIFKEAFKP
jgi:proline dehydrogenase|tara:strand:- start:2684 stop:3520 length:837 start_codon:yes stop_codon:yes gene_type:complete